MMETYSLSIADIRIRVILPPAKDIFFRNLLVKQLESLLSVYRISDNNAIKRTICFVEQPYPEFILHKNTVSLSIAHKQQNTFLVPYHISLRQFYWILGQIVLEEVAKKNGFFLHCSAINTTQGAVLFLGPSGRGKSTIARILNKTYPVLADDQIIIGKDASGYFLFQMFYPEKNKTIIRSINKYRIHKLFFLEQSDYNSQEKLDSKTDILKRMVSQLTTNSAIARRTMTNMLTFIKSTGDYHLLRFNLNQQLLVKFFHNILEPEDKFF